MAGGEAERHEGEYRRWRLACGRSAGAGIRRQGARLRGLRLRPALGSRSRRELIRRLGTSATQFYRLLDQTNYRKSVDQLVSLLQILDCDVQLVVRPKTA